MPDIDRKVQEERLYKEYVTDALKIAVGLDRRYADLLHPAAPERTPEEIVEHVKKQIGATK